MSSVVHACRFPMPRILLFSLLTVTLVLQLGCAKVQPEPFAQFEASTGQASALVAAVAKRDTASLRKMFIAQQAENPDFNSSWVYLDYSKAFVALHSDDVAQLTLSAEEYLKDQPSQILDGQTKSRSKPSRMLYLDSQENELALVGLNTSFMGYAKALSRLASGQAISKTALDSAKAGFEQFLGKASKPFPLLGKPEVSANLTQLLETGVQKFLEYKQRRDLINIIDAWQSIVDLYSSTCQYRLAISAVIFHNEYQATFTPLAEELNDLTPSRQPGKSDGAVIAKRASVIERMLNANDKLLADFAGLAALYQYYGILPAAHDALGRNLKRNTVDSTSLDSLVTYAKTIVDLYKSSTAPSAPAPTTQTGPNAAS